MKISVSLIALLVTAGIVADVSAVYAPRGRPGSIAGAVTSRGSSANSARATTSATTSTTTTETTDEVEDTTKDDNTEIETLGVTIGVARKACNSIYADANQALFNEETYECSIPVVAHNWSGIIQKDDKPVVAYIPLGTAMKCDADLFSDQVSALRRSSQWVVPVMVAGGAGVGAGVGYLMDKSADKKLAATKTELGFSSEETVDENTDNNNKANKYTYNGVTYDLNNPEDIEKARKELAKVDLSSEIKSNLHNLAQCMRVNFKNMVSTYAPAGSDFTTKWGFFVITENGDCDKNGKLFTSGGYNPNGVCYYRWPNPDPNSGKNTPIPVTGAYDGTFSYDQHRLDILREFTLLNRPDAISENDWKEVGDLQQLFSDRLPSASDATFEVKQENKTGTFVKIKLKSGKFGDIATGSETCSTPDNVLTGEVGDTNNRELESFYNLQGMLTVLINKKADSELIVKLNQVNGVIESNKVLNVLNKNYGTEDKGFFQKNVGKGLLVGAGVGAVGGLGYWFAEGASVFCNVGGLEQVKLNKTYSIPTFRDYIINHNYMPIE